MTIKLFSILIAQSLVSSAFADSRPSDEWIDAMTTDITNLLKQPDDGRLYEVTESYVSYIDSLNLSDDEKIELMSKVYEYMKLKNPGMD
jgi:hypothetical protein